MDLTTRASVLEIYNLICPNTDASSFSDEYILRHIKSYVSNSVIEKNNRINISDKEKEFYYIWRNSQKDNFSKEISLIIKDKINLILSLYPNTEEIYLTGSFVRGDYITKSTPKHIRDICLKIKGSNKISDYDFVIKPMVNKYHEEYKLDLLLDSDRNKKLIWNKNKGYV